MTEPRLAPLIGGVALLERAVGYLLDSLFMVTPAAIGNPTPCPASGRRAGPVRPAGRSPARRRPHRPAGRLPGPPAMTWPGIPETPIALDRRLNTPDGCRMNTDRGNRSSGDDLDDRSAGSGNQQGSV